VPSGLVAVVVPSGLSLMVQPHRWIQMRWWKAHSRMRLLRLVVPPWDRGLMWWVWQAAGFWWQPGAAQCRSRAMTARRRCGGTVGVAVPTSSGRLAAGGELGGQQAGAQERGEPGGSGEDVGGVGED